MVQANLQLVDAEEADHLYSLNQSLSAIQSLILSVPVLVIPVTAIVIVLIVSLNVKSRTCSHKFTQKKALCRCAPVYQCLYQTFVIKMEIGHCSRF